MGEYFTTLGKASFIKLGLLSLDSDIIKVILTSLGTNTRLYFKGTEKNDEIFFLGCQSLWAVVTEH